MDLRSILQVPRPGCGPDAPERLPWLPAGRCLSRVRSALPHRRITEVACNVHARRRFVEAADLLKSPGRPHEALAFYKELFRIERQIKGLTDEERLRARQERTVPLLTRFKAWLDNAVRSVLPKDSLGEAVHYALRHWSALTKFTEAGHLDASNNYAERCMRAVAVGRKAFLFVGSEHGPGMPLRSTVHWLNRVRRIR